MKTNFTDKQKRKRTLTISRIKRWVKKNSRLGVVVYSNWYCGITGQKGDKRLKQHIRLKKVRGIFFKKWNVDSMPLANDIEIYFHKLRMKNKPHRGGANRNSKCVYVFKINETFLDMILNGID